MVLLGVSATAVSGVLTPEQALAGYGDPIVWLVLAAFFMSRGMLKTGLGRRIAFGFIRAIGGRSLGLGYALASSDLLLASFIPSNGARAGGIVFPIAKSLAETYESRPGPTARRLGAFLMSFLYQCDVMASATFLTGQASNVLVARLAHAATGLELTYARWLAGAVVPALVAFGVVPMLLYRLYPPEVRETPRAADIAVEELRRMGPLGRDEWLMLATFALVAVLWMTTALHGINYAVVALIGISGLLVSGVLDWDDLTAERGAWEVFIWYGGIVRMAEALGETGITQRFAQAASGMTTGWPWWLALAVLLLIYFYAHYAFASITAHATAMFTPVPAGDPRGRRAALAGRPAARILLEPHGRADALRDHARPDLLRRRLRSTMDVVAARLRRLGRQPGHLDPGGWHVVEGARLVVSARPVVALAALDLP